MQVDEKGLRLALENAFREKAPTKLQSWHVYLADVAVKAILAYESARSAEPQMWGVRAPTSRQEATAMQIVAERWFAENGGPGAGSAESVAWVKPADLDLLRAGNDDQTTCWARPFPGAVPLYAHPTPEASDGHP